MVLESRFDFNELEPRISLSWNEDNVFKWSEKDVNTFVIDTPPPTVSGSLHMGHVFSYCHADFISRYKRLAGFNVFFPIGFDNNGLPTERLVEKTKNVQLNQLNHSEFLSMCAEISEHAKENFRRLFRSIGMSFDWNLEYCTMDDQCRKISQSLFIDLYKKGLVYRKVRPVIWDTKDKTAIAQAEIEEREVSSYMNYITFKVNDGTNVTIATTRPELLPACVCVFYHPDDLRYIHLEKKKAIVPMFGFEVPFLADFDVKQDKGTGLVMCCTFGDEQDVKWWERHNLKLKLVISETGKMESGKVVERDELGVASQIDGLNIFKARELVVTKLAELGILECRKEIVHTVKCAERSGSLIEIRVTPQWFISLMPYKQELLEKFNECNWVPEHMKKRIEIWTESLTSDWCISRQRCLGVQFPIWYSKKLGEEGNVILPNIESLPIDPKVSLPDGYSTDEVTPDYDVMDTWATSSLTPMISSFPHNTDKLFPADLRTQSHEIIRTWAFYTFVRALFYSNSIPWKNIMISGWCLAEDKSKMSKSKGNIVQPEKILSQYGADAVRLWAAKASLGGDTVVTNDAFKVCSKFINKLWNVGRFVEQFIIDNYDKNLITEAMDIWVLKKFSNAVKLAGAYFEKYDYCSALNALDFFFWNDFCDLYLEIVKKRAYGDESKTNTEVISARNCLTYLMKNLLIVFSPFVPFVSDYMFKNIFGGSNSVCSQGNWPNIREDECIYCDDAVIGDYCIEIVSAVRKIKSSLNLSVGSNISCLYIDYLEEDFLNKNLSFEKIIGDMKSVCCAGSVYYAKSNSASVNMNTKNFVISVIINGNEE